MTGNGTDADHTLNQNQIKPLKNRIWPVKQILELDGEFRKADAMEVIDADELIETFWTSNGAWKVVDYTSENPSDTKINIYRWNEPVRQYLKEYVDSEPTLPCGCRAHILNHPTQDGYSCRFCNDDPIYDQETVKECL